MHKKIRCRVERLASDTNIDPVLAWLYVLDAWEGGLPSAQYIGVMADAAEIAGAPNDYVHDLRTRPARNIGPGTSAYPVTARVCVLGARPRRTPGRGSPRSERKRLRAGDLGRGRLLDDVDHHPQSCRECALVEIERRLVEIQLRPLSRPHAQSRHRAGNLL